MEPFEKDSPFYGFQIASLDPLRSIDERYICPGCQRSARYFCYRCLQLAKELQGGVIPSVDLPLDLVVIKDKRELVGKTTAIHAKFIAPHQTTILEFDKTKGPNGGLEEKLEVLPLDGSAILFPSEDSKSVSEMDWSKFKRILVLDGTWKQAKMMCLTSPMLKDLPKVHLPQSNETKFWRYQNLGPHCLATIEAIYQFYQEFSQQMQSAGSESHKFDNMLYFYVHLYNRVQEEYRQNQVKRFTHRHGKASEYIKYD